MYKKKRLFNNNKENVKAHYNVSYKNKSTSLQKG